LGETPRRVRCHEPDVPKTNTFSIAWGAEPIDHRPARMGFESSARRQMCTGPKSARVPPAVTLGRHPSNRKRATLVIDRGRQSVLKSWRNG